MTPHQYLAQILAAQTMLPADIETLRLNRQDVEAALRKTYGSTPRIYYGGSYAKGTMIRAGFDLDIVIYFPSTHPGTLADMFNGVSAALRSSGYIVRGKNVAVRLPYDNFHIDVVPGRAQDATFKYATLYKSEDGSNRQTSIKVHIDSVKDAGVSELVKLIKRWRHIHGLDWSSFALEQVVVRALAGKRKDDFGTAVFTVLQYIEDNISIVRLVDPANSNNVIEMSQPLRGALTAQARSSRAQSNWGTIIW